MADISDVTAYLTSAAATAVYPNGTAQPSVANVDVRIFEGWPQPDQLDRDVAGLTLSGTPPVPTPRTNGPLANVSVFPMLGTTLIPYQILDNTYTIAQPTYGISVSISNGVITLSGNPKAGEYLTIVADQTYAYSSNATTTAAIISTLAANFSGNYSGVTFTSTTLTIPYGYSLSVRQGGIGLLGKVTHRQRQSVMISVWAPTHSVRTSLASAIDNYIKQSIRITLPDSSQAVVCYSRTNVIDDQQVATIYRRDLIYDVEYATVQQFNGFVITTVNDSLSSPGTPIPSVQAIT